MKAQLLAQRLPFLKAAEWITTRWDFQRPLA